jgi:polysaccharide pyruvyl transferase WcaK-like protein
MRLIALLDTSVTTDNLGDEIIMDAVRQILHEAIPDAYCYTIVTHDYLGRSAHKILNKCEFGIVGGTNFVSSGLLRAANWKVTPRDLLHMREIVFMGVGWKDYQSNPSCYASFFYNRVLSNKYTHSFRDRFSLGMASTLRKKSVYTGCPTMWSLTAEHCAAIPREKSKNAIVALTYYKPDIANDRALLELVRRHYERVFFWVQQAEDLAYFKSLGQYNFEVIAPNVAAYTSILDRENVDFIGSRLHGGIRALQRGRRAMIVVVDNRAAEIGRDTNLQICKRTDLRAIEAWIENGPTIEIKIAIDSINAWKAQFA